MPYPKMQAENSFFRFSSYHSAAKKGKALLLIRSGLQGNYLISCGRYGFLKLLFIQRFLRKNLRLSLLVGGGNLFYLKCPSHRIIYMSLAHAAGHSVNLQYGPCHPAPPSPPGQTAFFQLLIQLYYSRQSSKMHRLFLF